MCSFLRWLYQKFRLCFYFWQTFKCWEKLRNSAWEKFSAKWKGLFTKSGAKFSSIFCAFISTIHIKKIPFCVDNHQFFAIIWLWIDFEKYVKKFIFYIIKIKDCLRIDASKFWNVNKTIRLRAKIQTAKKESHLSFPWTRSKNRITVE